MAKAKAEPVLIQCGDWAWTDQSEDGGGDPALSIDDREFVAGSMVKDAAALRQLSLDLMRLAGLVASWAGSP
jgi:hypothetical protein